MKIASFAAFVLISTALRPAGAQTLSRSDIQRGVHAVRPAVDRCLRSARVSAVVKVRLEITAGRVSAVDVDAAGAASRCVERAVRAARFPRSARPMTVLYPFVARFGAPAAHPSGRPVSQLSRAQIARGVRAIRPAVERCRTRGGGPVLIKVRLEIAGGQVTRAQGASDAADSGVIACVEQAVRRATFPRAEPLTVHYPFLLH
jgi:hypothetical protein